MANQMCCICQSISQCSALLLYMIELFPIIWSRVAVCRAVTCLKNWINTDTRTHTHAHTDTHTHTHTHIYIIIIIKSRWLHRINRRCPWCNGYRSRKWTQRHEFKSWTRLIAFHIALIPLGKVWIQLISLPPYGSIVGQTRFFSLGEATSLGEGKLWIQTC